MKKISTTLLVLSSAVLFSQKISWQKNVESGSQDFLSGFVITVDGGNALKLVMGTLLNFNLLKTK